MRLTLLAAAALALSACGVTIEPTDIHTTTDVGGLALGTNTFVASYPGTCIADGESRPCARADRNVQFDVAPGTAVKAVRARATGSYPDETRTRIRVTDFAPAEANERGWESLIETALFNADGQTRGLLPNPDAATIEAGNAYELSFDTFLSAAVAGLLREGADAERPFTYTLQIELDVGFVAPE